MALSSRLFKRGKYFSIHTSITLVYEEGVVSNISVKYIADPKLLLRKIKKNEFLEGFVAGIEEKITGRVFEDPRSSMYGFGLDISPPSEDELSKALRLIYCNTLNPQPFSHQYSSKEKRFTGKVNYQPTRPHTLFHYYKSDIVAKSGELI